MRGLVALIDTNRSEAYYLTPDPSKPNSDSWIVRKTDGTPVLNQGADGRVVPLTLDWGKVLEDYYMAQTPSVEQAQVEYRKRREFKSDPRRGWRTK